MSSLELQLGREYKRRELHDFYGGQRQGGISTPQKYPYIFIITSKRGEEHGYVDGWIENNNFFLYTGEGQIGDMEFKGGNKAIKYHRQNDKQIFLFQETKKTFIALKAELNFIDYKYIQVPDTEGKNRRAIQFRLQSVNAEPVREVEPISITKPHLKPDKTERQGLVISRVGQGYYRQELIKKFNGRCAVTSIDREEILIASHIVPWRLSTDEERIDVDNGILLSPLYDALFDKHLISFKDDGEILIANSIKDDNLKTNIRLNAKIIVTEGMKKYLSRHRLLLR